MAVGTALTDAQEAQLARELGGLMAMKGSRAAIIDLLGQLDSLLTTGENPVLCANATGVTLDPGDQVFISDHRLTAQTGIRLQAPGLVQQILFCLIRLSQQIASE